jgi:hypothetical protein
LCSQENSCVALSNCESLDDLTHPAGGDVSALSPGKMAACCAFECA